MINWFQTFSGVKFDLLAPTPEMVLAEDIAHGLSNICRFGGHCKVFYSVAQHSILVSHEVPQHLAIYGLLHDAAEAYIGDIISPLKHCLPEIRAIEQGIMQAIAARFTLDLEIFKCPDVKKADMAMLATEARDLHGKPPATWTHLTEGPLPHRVEPMFQRLAKISFLDRWKELS